MPPGLPREVRHGLLWVAASWLFASQIGFEAPWAANKSTRDEWAKAHAAAVAQIETQGRSILVLQERDTRTQRDLAAISAKLDEMAMVLYSLERRTRE